MATKIPLAYADVELQLASSIVNGDTSFTLASANDDDGNELPAGLYCFTVDNGTSAKEYLLGTLNGTDVTSVKSLSRQGVETTGAINQHRVGASVIVTDFATIQRVADALRGALTLDGASPLSYDTAPSLSSGTQLATVAYVLSVVSGGTVYFNEQVISPATGGESIVAGDQLYFNTADQEWYKTDADTASTVEGVLLGIALGSGSNGVAITNGVQIAGVYTTTGLTAGATYYASNTAGARATSAGTTSQIIGVALSTTKLFLIPRTPQTVTTLEKSALAGSPSAPNATNTFVTKAKLVTAGATINGATTPVPVYQNKTDNEFYACDGNDTGALKFVGFAISNGTDGNSFYVQTSGIVSGFTGLDEGEKYYLSDTAGTISSTTGTYEVVVGVAISTTELLISKGKRRASGTTTFTGTSTTAITCGFRPSSVRIVATNNTSATGASHSISQGGWTVSGSNNCVYIGSDGSNVCISGTSNTAWLVRNGSASVNHSGNVTTITDTGFTLDNTETSGTTTVNIYWEAEGEQ